MNWLQSFNLMNTLSPLQWVILASIPPAILLLYFLKLKRQPLEVPSTYLWSRTIEDLHVNSIWQRLRQSLLLLLQLLLIALAILACLRPGWRGQELPGDRFIFLVDTSASMRATDVAPSRLDEAKRRVLEMIERMNSGDVAMIISCSNEAQVEQAYTNNRSLLRQKVNRIRATNRNTDMTEALRAAAGLANPGRTSQAGTNDVQVADALPATLFIYSDGGIPAVANFSLGNLKPVYIPIGSDAPENVGVVAFTAEQNPEKLGQTQAYARIQNSGLEDRTVEASLYLNETLVDASQVKVAQHGEAGVQFDLQTVDDGTLRLELDQKDHFALDDKAHLALGVARRARVLVVSAGQSDALRLAMTTEQATKVAELTFVDPPVLKTKEHQDQVLTGAYDFIVYDQCVPEKMPLANTLFIGNVPPLPEWSMAKKAPSPVILDIDRSHPVTQLVEMGNVLIAEGMPITGPQGARVLFDSTAGSLLVIAGRESFEDAALGVALVGQDDKGDLAPKPDWPVRRSFPVFIMNVLRYLGGNRGALSIGSVQPGESITLRSLLPVERMRIDSPAKQSYDVQREGQNAFVFTHTEEVGIYEAREGGSSNVSQKFAVNLFDPRESDINVREAIDIEYEKVAGQKGSEPTRRELWKWLLLLGLGIVLFEWYVYNRRVYF